MKHQYLLGIFDDGDKLLHATTEIRKAGYQIHEMFTPFPVHGLDKAMGLQESRLHTAGFVFGAFGTIFSLVAMGIIMAVDWPLIVGGKPYFPLPSFVPIMFEFTVLCSAIGMTVTMYIRNGFSVFRDQEIVYRRSSDDHFVMVFDGKRYNADEQAKIGTLLKEHSAIDVKNSFLNNELKPNLMTSSNDASLSAGHGHH
ncbi:MAG: DUF3341 domain-containing protein [Sphingobacteriales bacterium]|jgi:hypothetical protein|nr:DUF3341 domain-containing protein [Sphingobacteriales bacterium]MBP9141819.1 DUF3341 domain-containing protein [Chitinophagales bacterium]MDA0198879.1 DUF3341 domain-containing protein [Bacteroidota bacterium]MBK6889781.1 DUF3341 domain-containing protein [Sphingobacteriales bacterium]MBK7527703.1 DUF3341 domain-containing protein [Sphingobacteriales bacterium]